MYKNLYQLNFKNKLSKIFKKICVYSFTISMCACILSNNANAATRIDITQGNVDPLPIAINDFGFDEQINRYSEIVEVIKADLARSGLFRPIDRRAFIERLFDHHSVPDFSAWRQINAGIVVAGKIFTAHGNNIKVSFSIYDSYDEQKIIELSFIGTRDSWRVIAHKIADEIYKSITGEEGYFNSKIVFISEFGNNRLRKKKKLTVMDQDGANARFLTSGDELVLTPRFSPDSKKIIYLSYEKKIPKVFMIDLETKHKKLIGHFPGMSFAPRFSPDGRYIVMSVARGGHSDIYMIDLRSMKQTQLTSGSYIDTSPCFSADGRKIVFSSDRSGQAQIYIMNTDGSDQTRISFGKGAYHTPVWSPRGDYIAFTKQYMGNFHIGVFRTDGNGERILTEGYMVEGPNWSPNGRVIIFTKEDKIGRHVPALSHLQTIDLTGYHLLNLKTINEASDPSWSSLLK
jgi:TolB protein